MNTAQTTADELRQMYSPSELAMMDRVRDELLANPKALDGRSHSEDKSNGS